MIQLSRFVTPKLRLWCFGLFVVPVIAADELIGVPDSELLRLLAETEDACYRWRFFARHARTMLFPDNNHLPEDARRRLAQGTLALTGPHIRPTTSAGHQLAALLYDMAVARGPDEETAAAVYRECIKYDKRYVGSPTGGGGDHPNPPLRKPGPDNAR